PMEAMGMLALKQLFIYRQNPILANIEEAIIGREPVSGRPVPFPSIRESVMPKITGKQPSETKLPPVGWVESFGGKLPIPVAAAIRETFDAMLEDGISYPNSKAIAEGLAAGLTAFVGYHER